MTHDNITTFDRERLRGARPASSAKEDWHVRDDDEQ